MIGIVGAVSLLLSCALTKALLTPTLSAFLLDRPNERSLHQRPTPRSGGIAIATVTFVMGAAAAFLSEQFEYVVWIAPSAVLLVCVAFVDDLSDVRVGWRFATQCAAAITLLFGSFALRTIRLPSVQWELSTEIGVVLSFLYIVWMINLYNFMDGMDGLAGGMAVVGFGCYAFLAGLSGEYSLMSLSLVIASAAAGFLIFNFPPARIFMGDVGSSLLGFLAAALSLWAAQGNVFPLWIGILVFSPFVVDATVTLMIRFLGGHRVWEAHRSHFYQRLVQVGWGHRRTVVVEYALMLACSFSAVIAVGLDPQGQWLMIWGWVLLYTVFIIIVYRIEAREERTPA